MQTEINKKLSITVIMPALNEEKNIAAALTNALKALDDFNINGEIIVINDGSTDDTLKVVDSIMKKDKRIKLVNNKATSGVGASYWAGVELAKNDIITWMPGDNENDPWETLRYYELLDHVDIVIPFVFNKGVRSLFRNVLSFVYRFIINTTFGVNFNYTNSPVLIRRHILNEIDYKSQGFFFQTDILIKSVKKGYLFAEVPIRLGQRNEGISKAVSFPSAIQVFDGYLRLVKDFYFSKQNKKEVFIEDSLTAKRRKS
jgi:glycosyltransferase involved in cell wall biosynthesis